MKITKKKSQDMRFPGQDSKPRLSEWVTEVLTTTPWSSVLDVNVFI